MYQVLSCSFSGDFFFGKKEQHTHKRTLRAISKLIRTYYILIILKLITIIYGKRCFEQHTYAKEMVFGSETIEIAIIMEDRE